MPPTRKERFALQARRIAVTNLVRAFGRPIVCAECGERMFDAVPVVWRGELRLLGAHEHLVRVSFAWTYRLEFRHVELDQCPSPERPWVPRGGDR